MSREGFVVEIRRGNGSPKFLPLSPGESINPISVGLLGDFRLEADGVLDVHGYLYFDGTSLFVQSSDGHHQIRVNGKPIGPDWTAVQPPCTLALGDARLVYCPASQASAASGPAGPTSARAAGKAPPPVYPPYEESAPTMADARHSDYDDGVPTAKTRAPDDDATGSIPIPPAPHGQFVEDDNETTRALPLPVISPNLGARPPAPPPPPQPPAVTPGPIAGPIAAPPTAPVTAAKVKPLDQLKDGWKQASLPKKAIAMLLPVAFVMVIFGLDDNTPQEEPTATAPSASASTKAKAKPKPAATEDPEELEPAPKPTASATTAPVPTSKKAHPPPEPTPAPVLAAKDKTPERAAVDAVAAGAWEPAAKAYDDLAKQHPENPAYKEAARILRAKAKK